MKTSPKFRIFTGFIVVVALASVSFGLTHIESPAVMRLKKTDKDRINALRTIAHEAEKTYLATQTVPASLESLKAGALRFVPISDPKTGTTYGYRVIGDSSIELCATFETANIKTTDIDDIYIGGRNQDMAHDVGNTCFTFDVKQKVLDHVSQR